MVNASVAFKRVCETFKIVNLNAHQQEAIAYFVDYAPINVKPAGRGGGRGWGGDLIVFVGPGIGHLTDLVLPGEGIFESFFTRRRDI